MLNSSRTALLLLASALIPLARAQSLITVDASAAYTPPGPSAVSTGSARTPDGHTLGLNQRFLTRDGKPWLPVMGEFHFSRFPASQWDSELAKMKSAGVDIVSTYVIWIHHEEIEGQFDWTGDRDLRRFAQLCANHHLYLYVRIGPWSHGEVRNGGFPDWLLKKGPTRVNDPAYLSYVTKFYDQIGQQLEGLLWKDGGPVLGVQIENEYSSHAPNGGAAHILELKRLAIADGLDVPYYSVTGWDRAAFPQRAVLPVFGGYPDAPWDSTIHKLPPSEVYTFRFHNRVTANMGAMRSHPGTHSTNPVPEDTPFLTAEIGGGIEDTYHRRPIIAPDDIAAIFPTLLGSGVNLYGIYMFHGGENPDGKLSTLQESQATGYPNDLPIKSYDFQAPLGEFGQERPSLRKLKLYTYFLNAFGDQLAPMTPHAPDVLPQSPADLSVPRLAVRSEGDHGFLFVNNYLRGGTMPARAGFQVSIALPGNHSLVLPTRPIDVPSGAYFLWPFNMDLGTIHLDYSTAQLFTRLDPNTFVFFCIPGIRCELVFADRPGLSIEAPGGVIRSNKTDLISHLPVDRDSAITFHSPGVPSVHILVLTQRHAEDAWRVHIAGREHLLLTPQELFTTDDQITLQSDGSPDFQLTVRPALEKLLPSSSPVKATQHPDSTELTADLPSVDPHLTLTQIKQPGEAPPVKLGRAPDWRPQGVAEAPVETTFAADAAQWKLSLGTDPLHNLSNLFLRIDYTGDVARLTNSHYLLDDNFFNGTPWTVGLKRFLEHNQTGDLQLHILPLRADSPIFFEDAVRKTLPATGQIEQLHSVHLIPQYQLTFRIAP